MITMPMPTIAKGNGFTEFDNDRGEVERLLVPFRALGDDLTLQAPHGSYSRFDVFGFVPKQHEGYLDALWEAWRLWQREGFPHHEKHGHHQRVQRVRPSIKVLSPSAARGAETWRWVVDKSGSDGKGEAHTRAEVRFEAHIASDIFGMDTGIPQDSGQYYLTSEAYAGAAKNVLDRMATREFYPPEQEGDWPPPQGSSKFWPKRFWHHLIYAYFIEATKIIPICRKLITDAETSEQLGFFHEASQRWMRSTIALWNPATFAIRRNAYHRMFGLDLGEVTSPDAGLEAGTNAFFVPVFEDLLYEVWNGYMNHQNSSGPNTTDPVAIVELCQALSDMLNERRQFGTLTRAEFSAVAELSWYYLLIDGRGTGPDANAPVILDMKVTATTPDERLRRLGDAVGVPAHPRTRSLLKLAERVSLLLIEIEQGTYNEAFEVRRLYEGGETTNDLLDIINEWSILTGRDIKARRVAPQLPRAAAKAAPLLSR
ncbi:Hypothetical protein A7982_06867 [Minicystis rosea]|nr:Hypothetical protein A7982_06867 [Minicystis rosea]